MRRHFLIAKWQFPFLCFRFLNLSLRLPYLCSRFQSGVNYPQPTLENGSETTYFQPDTK